jgi:hypothetical protein
LGRGLNEKQALDSLPENCENSGSAAKDFLRFTLGKIRQPILEEERFFFTPLYYIPLNSGVGLSFLFS